jgi:hypothetical protein
MPLLAQRDRPFRMVLSRLKKAELLVLAGALALEIAQGATVLHLQEITKQKLQDDAPMFIYNPNYQSLYTRKELQDLRQTHPAADRTVHGAGPGADNQIDLASQAALQQQSRSQSAESRSGSVQAEGLVRTNPRASVRPAHNGGDRASNTLQQDNGGRDSPESSGENVNSRTYLPQHEGARERSITAVPRGLSTDTLICRMWYTVSKCYMLQTA